MPKQVLTRCTPSLAHNLRTAVSSDVGGLADTVVRHLVDGFLPRALIAHAVAGALASKF